MTGHGRGVAEAAGRRATVEIRSVNHRFFDLKLRGPSVDPRLEERVAQAIRRRVERGSFTVVVREEMATGAQVVRVDLALARSAYAALDELRRELAISEPVSLALVAAQSGVLQVGEGPSDDESAYAALAPAIEAALDELCAMRAREGNALAVDLSARLEHLDRLAAEVKGLAAAGPDEWRRRLHDRIGRLVGSGVVVDEARLAQEIAVLADRVDVTEELVRLASHVAQMRALLGEDAPVGRRLDFLTQELGREVNTIGSKSQSADIAARVVAAKAEVEKIREQVQNVE